MRRLNFTEENSGIALKNLETSLTANQTSAVIDSLHIQTRSSDVRLGKVNAHFDNFKEPHQYTISTTLLPSHITPSEFAPLYADLSNLTSPVQIEGAFDANEQQIKLSSLRLNTEDHAILMHSDVRMAMQPESNINLHADVHQLQVTPNGLSILLSLAHLDESTKATLARLGQISMTGQVDKNNDNLLVDFQAQTDAGDLAVNGNYTLNDQKYLSAHLHSEQLNLGQITSNPQLGQTTFSLDVDGELVNPQYPKGTIYGEITALDYKGYTYNNIFLDGTLTPDRYSGLLSIEDEHLQMAFDGSLVYPLHQQLEANMTLSVAKFEPHALNLTSDYANETFCFTAFGNLRGKDLASAIGEIVFDSIVVRTPEQTYTSQAITISSEQLTQDKKHIRINSDFIDATFVGNINYTDIVPSFQNQLAQHLPSLIHKAHTERKMDTAFDFSIELTAPPPDSTFH